MKIRRLLFLLVVVILAWATARWWLPWLLSFFTSNSELIQTIDSAINIISGVSSFILVFLGIRALTNEKEEKADSPIQPVTTDELRARLGKIGGQVNWIDRGVSRAGDLREHDRIVFTGKMKLGKTREAIELIRRAVDDDQVLENRIFVPSPAFSSLSKEKIQKTLEGIDPTSPIVIFLDDLPRDYVGEGLDRLAELLRALERCVKVLMVATAREDQLTDGHRSWLRRQGFYEISPDPFSLDHTGRLLDSTTGLLEFELEEEARQILLEARDGTPELTLISLRRLKERGVKRVNGEIA